MPHLDPVPLEDVKEDDIRQRFEHYQRTRGFTPNSIMTMVRRPNIVRAFMALNQAVLLFSPAERAAIGLALKAGAVPNEAAQADFDALKKHYNDEQIVEIVASIALFGYLNR